MKKILYALAFFSTVYANAQTIPSSVIGTTGQSYANGSMILDWTLGEVAVLQFSNADNAITQGFHQPIDIVNSTEQPQMEGHVVRVYPNPTSDWLSVEMDLPEQQDVEILIYEAGGRMVGHHRIQNADSSPQTLSLQYLPAGMYYMDVTVDGQTAPTVFTISKFD